MRRSILAGLLLLASPGLLPAAEEITSFASTIQVRADGKLLIKETIAVIAEGEKIKRGIYRDFPTIYAGPLGLRSEVPFRVIKVERDGRSEPWRIESRSNGVRVYIGSKDVLLPRGPATYTITYETGHQLGFFDGFTELYWNVTGNGWDFPILAASACVELPAGARVRTMEAYTGKSGMRGQDWKAGTRAGCDAFLETTATLQPNEGFTIVVSWPDGFVARPGWADDARALVSANSGVALGFAGLIFAAAYFIVMWTLVGRDPARGVIIARYEPPVGMTPPDVRLVNGLGTFDQTSVTAGILDLAVKGALTIEQKAARTYALVREKPDRLDASEKDFHAALFQDGSPLDLEQRNHQTLRAAKKVLSQAVWARNRKHFSRNTLVWGIGLAISLVPLAVSLRDTTDAIAALFLMVWLSIWTCGCAAISMSALAAWSAGKFLTALPATLFAVPFLIGWVFGLTMLVFVASPWVCGVYAAAVVLCAVFHYLLKRPTIEGQKIRDEIRGFRHYLAVAEAERMNLENPPERTPALFEKFLPYALALGVSQEWAEQFANVLEMQGYQPAWYHGTAIGAFSATTFASGMSSSFGSAISSASTAPGSRSGGGGGGSSGGGGGGGGGGGW